MRIQKESGLGEPSPAELLLVLRWHWKWHYCKLAMYGMCRKFSAWSNPYPTRNSFGASNPMNRVGIAQLSGNVLVEQRANLNGSRFPCLEQVHQPAQRSTRIDDVFDQQNVLSLELGLRIVQQADVAAGLGRVAVARRHQEIDLQRPTDLAHQVTEKYKAPLQEPEHEQLAVGIRRR